MENADQKHREAVTEASKARKAILDVYDTADETTMKYYLSEYAKAVAKRTKLQIIKEINDIVHHVK